MYDSTIGGFSIRPIAGQCQIPKSFGEYQPTARGIRHYLYDCETVCRELCAAGDLEATRAYAKEKIWKVNQLFEDALRSEFE